MCIFLGVFVILLSSIVHGTDPFTGDSICPNGVDVTSESDARGGAAGEVDVATMLQAKVVIGPEDNQDWWLAHLDESRRSNGDGGHSMASMLEHLVDSEIQQTSKSNTDGSVLSLIKHNLEVEQSAMNVSVVPAPMPGPAGSPQSTLLNNSVHSDQTHYNFSMGPADVDAAATPAPSPYSAVDDKPAELLQPVKKLSDAEKAALNTKRQQALNDCVVDTWGDWSDCRQIQGALFHAPFQQRLRRVVQHASSGGKPCPMPLDESRICDD